MLRQGASAWAAIGAAPDACHPDGVLTFGLIWLDYLRRRKPSLAVRGLVLYLPAGREKTTCLRLLFLNPAAAQYRAFVYDNKADDDALEQRVDLDDYGNLDTHLEPYRRRTFHPPLTGPDVETIERGDGELSFRVHGLEFARTAGPELLTRLGPKRAAELSRLRSPDAADHSHPLYRRNPEAWLESEVRRNIQRIDACLLPTPVYGQVPAFAAADRGVLDLLAIDHRGRLAVIELKASEDVHLPLQALDYWMRVQWHVERRELSGQWLFPRPGVASRGPSAAPGFTGARVSSF